MNEKRQSTKVEHTRPTTHHRRVLLVSLICVALIAVALFILYHNLQWEGLLVLFICTFVLAHQILDHLMSSLKNPF